MKKIIDMLKVMRLIAAIGMILSLIVYGILKNYYTLISLDLIMVGWISLFVFLLGLQYHFEKKLGKVALFLMMFAVVMFIMTIVGVLY